MDAFIPILLLALVISNIFCAWQLRHWITVAKLNNAEAVSLALELSRVSRDSHQDGYVRGLKVGVASMYQAATRGHVHDLALAVLKAEAHKLVGEPDEQETIPSD